MKNVFTLFFLFSIFSLGIAQSQYQRVSVIVTQEDVVQIQKEGISLECSFHDKNGELSLEVTTEEVNQLKALGLNPKVLIEDMGTFYAQRLNTPHPQIDRNKDREYSIPEDWDYGSMGGYLTLEEIYDHLDNMAAKYPNLISVKEQIGDIETHEGRPLYWVKISDNPNVDEDEPEILYNAAHHAREAITPHVLIYYMYYLLENYETDDEIKSIVDNTELYFVPCVNPDGYNHNHETDPNGGGMWRKNRRDNGDGTMGVDLNRNYGYKWGLDDYGSSPNPSDETYRGPSPFSEPECQAMKLFCEEREFVSCLCYHSYSGLLLFAWGHKQDPSPHHELLMQMGEILTTENTYTYGPASVVIYETNGDAIDWMYGDTENKETILSFTPEVGWYDDGFWPSQDRILPLIQDQMFANLSLAKMTNEYYSLSLQQSLVPKVGTLIVDVTSIGCQSSDNTTIEAVDTDNVFSMLGDPQLLDLNSGETQQYEIPYELCDNVLCADEFTVEFKVMNDIEVCSVEHKYIYGEPTVVFEDNCDNTELWNCSSDWSVTNDHFFSEQYSIGIYPYENYSSDLNTTFTLNSIIDLTEYPLSMVQFMVKYDIEKGFDYATVEVQEVGSSEWESLEGLYTTIGQSYSDPNIYQYSGSLWSWNEEWLSLKDYIGKQVKLRFRFFSDSFTEGLGFFFDDFKIVGVVETGIEETTNLGMILFYPNPTSQSEGIHIEVDNSKPYELEVCNILGQQIINEHFTHDITVKNNRLSAGIYFFKIKHNNQIVKTQKVVIQ